MAFTIPNAADAIEYPPGSGIYPQAQPDSVDWQILAAGAGGANGLSSGAAVTEHVSPAGQSVDVASGTVVVANAEAVVSSGQVSATPAHTTLPRFDLVVVNASGTKSIVDGTAASSPVFPAIPGSSVVLAAVFRRPGDNVITNNEIVDKRVTVASPLAPSGWTTVSKVTDTTRSNTTTYADDPALLFAMSTTKTYRIRGVIRWSALLASDIKFTYNGPASPTRVLIRHREFNGVTAVESPAYDAAYLVSHPITSSANQEQFLMFDAVITNGANAGNFAIQWAQSTAVVENTVVRAGSYIEYKAVD